MNTDERQCPINPRSGILDGFLTLGVNDAHPDNRVRCVVKSKSKTLCERRSVTLDDAGPFICAHLCPICVVCVPKQFPEFLSINQYATLGSAFAYAKSVIKFTSTNTTERNRTDPLIAGRSRRAIAFTTYRP